MHRSKWIASLAAAFGVALAASPARALPLISEVFYDAVGTDDGNAFVELAGSPGASLAGVRIQVVNGDTGSVALSLLLSGAFGEDGLFVVADRTSAGTTSIANADLLLDFDLQNGPDSIVLRDAAGVLDAVGYGVFGVGQVFAGEGTPAIDAPAGSSLARHFADVDTGDNALDFGALAVPTPGQASFASIPEPATAGLLGLGVVGLARRRTRRG